MTVPTRIDIMHKTYGRLVGGDTCATCQHCHLVPVGGVQAYVYKCDTYPDPAFAVDWDRRWPACGAWKP